MMRMKVNRQKTLRLKIKSNDNDEGNDLTAKHPNIPPVSNDQDDENMNHED